MFSNFQWHFIHSLSAFHGTHVVNEENGTQVWVFLGENGKSSDLPPHVLDRTFLTKIHTKKLFILTNDSELRKPVIFP
jgi:hypothetical protein